MILYYCDCAILPLMFVCHIISVLYTKSFLPWIITYGLLALYSCRHLPYFIRKMKNPQILRSFAFPFAYLIVIHLITVLAIQSGITTYTAFILLGGYDLLAFSSSCLYRRYEDRFLAGLKWTALIIELSAVMGLFVFFFMTFFPQSPLIPYVTILQYTPTYIRICSVYRNPLPASTAFLAGIWLPCFFQKRTLQVLEKSVLVAAVILTLSRSAWLGLAISVLIYGLRHANQLISYFRKKPPKQFYLFSAAFIAIIVILLYQTNVGRLLFSRLLIKRTDNPYYMRVSYMGVLWKESFHGNVFEILFGRGMRSADSVLERLDKVLVAGFKSPESIYDCLLYDFGLVFLVYLVVLIIRALKQYRIKQQSQAFVYCTRVLIACAVPVAFYAVGYWPVPTALLLYCFAVMW